MARSGHRYHLILYSYMLNRWWKFILAIGAILLAVAAAFSFLPKFLPQFELSLLSPTALLGITGAGAFAMVVAFFLITVRKSAYVQPFGSYLRLVTPFLKMNISYRRIRQSTSVEMGSLFPPANYKGTRRKLLRPLASSTAIVLEMTGWPLPRRELGLFLSPYFFPDRSPRLALLVSRWMELSSEMESFRGAWLESTRRKDEQPQSDLLASFSKKKQ
jgi:hypothetical protein